MSAAVAAVPMTADDAVMALRARLRAARYVQADFTKREVPHRWPVTLSIEEATLILRRAEIPEGHVRCPDCEGSGEVLTGTYSCGLAETCDCRRCDGQGVLRAEAIDA